MSELKRVTTPYSYSFAVEAGDFIFLSGHLVFGDSFPVQLDDTYPSLTKTLAEFGLTPANLVKVHVSFKNIKDFPAMEKRFRSYFEKDKFPAVTCGSSEMLDSKILAIVDSIASRKEVDMTEIKYIPTPFSYSAAVAAGDYVFLGLHRGWGDDFTKQFDDTFKNLKKTLAQFDLTLASLVKVNVWLKNIEDIRVYEKLFNKYFEKDKFPARTGATTKFIDDDCLFMIDGVAYRKNR
jgi:2-iminobutanoate/2-iminopropanoate deaminase